MLFIVVFVTMYTLQQAGKIRKTCPNSKQVKLKIDVLETVIAPCLTGRALIDKVGMKVKSGIKQYFIPLNKYCYQCRLKLAQPDKRL